MNDSDSKLRLNYSRFVKVEIVDPSSKEAPSSIIGSCELISKFC